MSSTIVTIRLKIDGMSCSHCENKIYHALRDTKGILKAKVSYSSNTAEVTYDTLVINREEIIYKIEELDYKVVKEAGVSPSSNSTSIVGVLIVIAALFIIFNHFGGSGIFNMLPLATQGMGYGMLFVIGLLTSIHCLAMCGGINLSQCVSRKTGTNATLRQSILYNIGRVISYTVLGVIIGAIGSVVSFSGTAKGIIQLLAGIFMVIMGLNMLNIFPWLHKLNPRMPRIFARSINKKKNSNSPFFVGLLNGLMPCGPLQAMQLYALSTGDPIKGGLAMLVFSLGTVPLMFGLGALSSVLSKKFTGRMMAASAVLVIVLGVFMLNRGLSLSGVSLPFISSNSANTQTENIAQISGDTQTITTSLSPGSYEPIIVQKGVPVTWIIEAEESDINGCNYEIVIPEYNIEKELQPGQNIIEFTPAETGTIPYSCWMGMIRSKITVVEDVTQDNIETDTSQSEESYSNQGLASCCQ